jgi:hypothetical protein
MDRIRGTLGIDAAVQQQKVLHLEANDASDSAVADETRMRQVSHPRIRNAQ